MRSILPGRMADGFNDLKRRLKNRSPGMSAGIAVCLSMIATLLLPTFLSDHSIGFSNSFLSVAFAVVLFLLFRNYLERGHAKRELALTHLFGFLLSCMTSMGSAVERTGQFFPVSAAMLFAILLYTHVFACAVSLLWFRLSELEQKKMTFSPGGNSPASKLNRCLLYIMTHRWLIALILLLCWLPCWLALFPGGFCYDTENEFNQQFLTYKSDFPRLHSALIIGCLNAAHALFGSYNAGIAIYAAVQMVAFSAMFADMLATFHRKKLRPGILLVLAAYFAFFPVIALIVTHIGRDTLFAGLLTYLGFLFYQLASDSREFFSRTGKPLLLGAVLSLTILSRNNNSEIIMLALLVIMNAVVLIKTRRRHSKGIRAFVVSNIFVFVFLSLALNAICQPITGANLRASMSLVSQTLVRAYIDEPEKWTEQDRADYEYHINMEHFRYCAECADYSKNLLRNIKGAGNGVRFVRLWLRMGVKCPGSYLNAFLAQTRYMWYPDSLIDGYVRAELYETEKCYFSTGVSNPGHRISLWPRGEAFYWQLSRSVNFEKIPLLSMLFSIGFQYWLLLHCVFYAIYRRRKRLLLPLGAMMVYLFFCFFIPIVLMRYFMPLFLFFPLTVVMTIHPALPAGEKAAIVPELSQETAE